ncbi:MAG: class I SAM-dependent methyltransferase [Oscillospiraceae bacterium]|nr:class I SAM-dependent methyltransferase [Oscillospiraceae bacterium]
MKLEKMGAFFETRLGGYEEHMLTDIESAGEFYPFTASCLPDMPGANILDLGCGTGLEMDWYFRNNPSAKVTGIDLSKGMLATFKGKYADKDLNLICASYFDVPFGENIFDAAVSVQSLHHFTMEENVPLYTKLRKALKPDGFFILTDYFSLSDKEEKEHRVQLLRLKAEQKISDNEFYHYDTPLTVEHECEALRKAGFTSVEVLKNWGATYTLKATVEEV